MAEALRIRTLVSSKTLTLSDLERFIGKHVEVVVREDEPKPPASARRLGTLRGQIEIAEDFDAPLPEDLQRAFD